jgi:type I restriction enzyme, S subunit
MMKYERLGDIANIQIGKTPKREIKSYWGKGHPWVSIADLKGRVIHRTKEQITDLAVKECGCKLIEQGTLLLSFKLSIGKLAFAGTDLYTNEAICGLKIIDNSKVFPEYLFYALKAIRFGGSNVAAKGSTLNTASLNALKIPFPETINDQIKIATILKKAENLILLRKESISLLDEFLRSTFSEMFGSTTNNVKNFDVEPLHKFGNIITGNTPPRDNPQNYSSSGIEWIKTDNIESDKMFVTDASEKLSEIGEQKSRAVKNGALLVACIAGSIESVGRAALTDRRVSFNQQINAIQPFQDVEPYYLYWLFKVSKKYIQNSASKGMKKILTKGDFENIRMIKPRPQIQKTFTRIVEKAEALKKQLQTSLDELYDLYNSLSQRAFKGELDLKKIVIEYEEEYSATDNDRTEPKPINYENVTVRPKRIPEMSLDEHYGIPEEIVAEYGSIETKVVDWPFFLKKHFFDRPVKIDDLAELFDRIYYEEGLYFKYDEFKEFLFEELKKEKPFLKQEFNEDSQQLELTIIHETSKA